MYDSKGKANGICCTGNIKGTNKVLSISIYRKSAEDYLKPVGDMYYDAFLEPFEHLGSSPEDTEGIGIGNTNGNEVIPQNGGSNSGNYQTNGGYSPSGGYSTSGSYTIPGYYAVPGYTKSISGYTLKGGVPQRHKKNQGKPK